MTVKVSIDGQIHAELQLQVEQARRADRSITRAVIEVDLFDNLFDRRNQMFFFPLLDDQISFPPAVDSTRRDDTDARAICVKTSKPIT